MADNEIDLIQWQIGVQSAFDIAAAPTKKIMGLSSDGALKPIVEASGVEEQRGSFVPAYAATVDKIGGEATISGAVSFEQIGYFLDSLYGSAVPTGGGPYTRCWLGPTVSKPASKILTVVRGSPLDSRKLTGGIVNEINLKAEANARTTFEANLIGHSVSAGALSALPDLSVNFLHANQMTLFLDAFGGPFGGTAISPTVFTAELALNTNKSAKYGLRAAAPLGWKQNKSEADSNQLKMGVELETATAAWLTGILAASGQAPWRPLVRLRWAIDANNILEIDYAGWCPEAPEISGDSDGISQIEFTLNPLYNAELGSWIKISLTNQIPSYAS